MGSGSHKRGWSVAGHAGGLVDIVQNCLYHEGSRDLVRRLHVGERILLMLEELKPIDESLGQPN